MILALKTIHIAALVIWCAGLIAMPGLFALRPKGDEGPLLWRLQRFARAAFIRVISPAAMVAIGSGTGLIFAASVFDGWFALKLVAVGLLAIVHVRTGFVIVGVFKRGGHYGRKQALVMQGATVAVIGAILWLVLAKPAVDVAALPAWATTPGGLQSLSETLRPMP